MRYHNITYELCALKYKIDAIKAVDMCITVLNIIVYYGMNEVENYLYDSYLKTRGK